MASSKVMPSSSTSTNSDLNSLPSHHHHHHHHFLSPSSQMISDFAADLQPPSDSSNTLLDADISLIDAAGAIDGSIPAESKTVEDVWREIVAGKSNERVECKVEAAEEVMTLEDFLAKAGAGMEGDEPEQEGMMVEEDVKLEVSAGIPMAGGGGVFGFDHQLVPASYSAGMGGVMGYGNGGGGGMGGGVRGKRRGGPILEPLDKAAQQRQRRMIKNRESAARSRERKQAYQVELESLASKLEEENEQLLREKAERSKARFKQLMEKVIPVVERRRPPRALRRVRSMEW